MLTLPRVTVFLGEATERFRKLRLNPFLSPSPGNKIRRVAGVLTYVLILNL